MSREEARPQASSGFDPEAEQEVDFGRYARLLAARWWLLAAGLVAGAIVGYAISLGGSQVWKASATIYLGQPYTTGGNSPIQTLQTNPATVGTIVHSEAVDEQVAASCKTRAAAFRGGISSQVVAGSVAKGSQNPLVSVTVQAKTRKISACAANGLAAAVVQRVSAYANAKIASFRAQIANDRQTLDTMQASLASGNVPTTDKLILQLQLRTVKGDETNAQQLLYQATSVEAPKILTPASGVRVTARSRRNSVVVVALIGLVLGALAALGWDRVGSRVPGRARPA